MSGLLERDRAALLVIDVQDRINAVMSSQDHLPRIEVLVEAFQSLDIPIIASEQYPQGLGSTVESLATILGDTPPAKLTFSCARDDGLRGAVEDSGRQQIVVTGIEAHVCVLQTALDLLNAGYEVHVPYDAVNSRRKSDRKWALRRMASAGAIITATESALFELVERCDTADFKTVAKLIKKIPVRTQR
jgi:nicotinamidase-related amidase